MAYRGDFNPHEREARDIMRRVFKSVLVHFNPHEREARDIRKHGAYITGDNFNPHEREARDRKGMRLPNWKEILIHTSVKLVTS